jgi:hypothetical protein
MTKTIDTTAAEKFIHANSKHTAHAAVPAEIGEDDTVTKAGKAASSVRTITQSGYLDFMKEVEQIEPETVKAFAAAEQNLITGAIAVATSDLVAQINEAKLAGDDPRELDPSVVKISRPSGQINIGVSAQTSVPNPKTGERSVRVGQVKVGVRTHSLISSEAAKQTQETIGKLLGG